MTRQAHYVRWWFNLPFEAECESASAKQGSNYTTAQTLTQYTPNQPLYMYYTNNLLPLNMHSKTRATNSHFVGVKSFNFVRFRPQFTLK